MRILRTIIFLLVVIGLIWLLVILFRSVFTAGSNNGGSDMGLKSNSLSSYARPGTSVSYTYDGPINMNQLHRTIVISVDTSQSKIELLSGYDGTVVQQQVFPNTQTSYQVFLSALDTLGFSRGNTHSTTSVEGQCPLNYRYTYQLIDGGQDVFNFWSTSCGTGTFKGQRSSVGTLFTRQIPPDTYNQFSQAFSNPTL